MRRDNVSSKKKTLFTIVYETHKCSKSCDTSKILTDNNTLLPDAFFTQAPGAP